MSDVASFKKRTLEIIDWLEKELSKIRTGRATIALLDSVFVNAYGSRMPLNQNASISIEDPKTIRITPWDKGLIQEIEKGISLADLGVSTSVDGVGIRVIFPSLTTETREKLVKQGKVKIEEAKVSIRGERNKIMKEIDELPEDDAKRRKDEVEKIIKETNEQFDLIAKRKEEEIMN